MRRPLHLRKPPDIDMRIHCALVKLDDSLKVFLRQTEPLNMIEMKKLCEVIKELQTMRRVLPDFPKLQHQHKQFSDLIEDQDDITTSSVAIMPKP